MGWPTGLSIRFYYRSWCPQQRTNSKGRTLNSPMSSISRMETDHDYHNQVRHIMTFDAPCNILWKHLATSFMREGMNQTVQLLRLQTFQKIVKFCRFAFRMSSVCMHGTSGTWPAMNQEIIEKVPLNLVKGVKKVIGDPLRLPLFTDLEVFALFGKCQIKPSRQTTQQFHCQGSWTDLGVIMMQ